MPDIATIGEPRASAIVRGRRYDFIHPREGKEETTKRILALIEKWSKVNSGDVNESHWDAMISDARFCVMAILPEMPEYVRRGLDMGEMLLLITNWGTHYAPKDEDDDASE